MQRQIGGLEHLAHPAVAQGAIEPVALPDHGRKGCSGRRRGKDILTIHRLEASLRGPSSWLDLERHLREDGWTERTVVRGDELRAQRMPSGGDRQPGLQTRHGDDRTVEVQMDVTLVRNDVDRR